MCFIDAFRTYFGVWIWELQVREGYTVETNFRLLGRVMCIYHYAIHLDVEKWKHWTHCLHIWAHLIRIRLNECHATFAVDWYIERKKLERRREKLERRREKLERWREKLERRRERLERRREKLKREKEREALQREAIEKLEWGETPNRFQMQL